MSTPEQIKLMTKSPMSNVRLEGSIQGLGAIEEYGDLGIVMKFVKWFTILEAKFRGWTPQDIEDSLEEGRKTVR